MYNNPYGQQIANKAMENQRKWVLNAQNTGQIVDFPAKITSQGSSIGAGKKMNQRYSTFPQVIESYSGENPFNKNNQQNQRELGRMYGSGYEKQKNRGYTSLGMTVSGSLNDMGYYPHQEKEYATLGTKAQMKPKKTVSHSVMGKINPKALLNLAPNSSGGGIKEDLDEIATKGIEEFTSKLFKKKSTGKGYFKEIQQPKVVNLKDLFKKKLTGKGFPRSVGGATKKQVSIWDKMIKTTV